MTPFPVAMIFVLIFGLCVGSFLNVVVARLPAGRSIISPGSTCPGCGSAIAWYDNLPVLSYAMLHASCRTCRTQISWRYPAVELTCGVLFAMAYLHFGPSLKLVGTLILLSGLIAITGIDLDHQIIPDVLSIPGIVAGLLWSLTPYGIGWEGSCPRHFWPAAAKRGRIRCRSGRFSPWEAWSASSGVTHFSAGISLSS